MRITVLLFAGHRERAGTGRLELTLPDGATIESVFRDLAAMHPAIAETEPFTKFARNRQIAQADEKVADGDEIALLQPVSGG